MDVRQAPTGRDSVRRIFAATANPALIGYAWAVGATVASTLVGFAMRGRFDLVNIAMVHLLAVVLVALHHARGPAILTSALCIMAFDVLFVPPAGSLTVNDLQYVFTFAIMLTVGLGDLASRCGCAATSSGAGGIGDCRRDREDPKRAARLDLA